MIILYLILFLALLVLVFFAVKISQLNRGKIKVARELKQLHLFKEENISEHFSTKPGF